MSNPAPLPLLIIGLGATGLRTASLVRQVAERRGLASPALIGLGAEPPPPNFPATAYLCLDPNPERLLATLQTLPDAHLAGWFDLDLLRESAGGSFQYPVRPFERLAWYTDLQRAEQSSIYRLWHSQLRQALPKRFVTYLIADLAEPIASGLFLDVAQFSTALAADQSLNTPLVLLGVRPGGQATDEEKVRAAAAVREWVRLSTTVDSVYGMPFAIVPESSPFAASPLWRGQLRSQPFAACYLAERTPGLDMAAESAALLSAYLDPDVIEFELQRMVNAAQRYAGRSASVVWVGTARVRSVAVPVGELIQFWSAGLLQRTLAPWLTDAWSSDAHPLLAAIDRFWRGFERSSVEAALADGAAYPLNGLPHPLAERLPAWEQQLLTPTYRALDARQLLTGRDALLFEKKLPTDPTAVQTFFGEADRLLHAVGLLDGALTLDTAHNPYRRLLDTIYAAHEVAFLKRLHDTLTEYMNDPAAGLSFGSAFLGALLTQVQRVRQTLPATVPTLYDATAEDYHALGAFQAEILAYTGLMSSRKRALRTRDYQAAVSQLVYSACHVALVHTTRVWLARLDEHIGALRAQLSAWRVTLELAAKESAQVLSEASADAQLEMIVLPLPTRLDDQWAQQQEKRYLLRETSLVTDQGAFTLRLDWTLQTTAPTAPYQVQLTTPAQLLSLDGEPSIAVVQALRDLAARVFETAAAECSIGQFLADNRQHPAAAPPRLATHLVTAERALLRVNSQDVARRSEMGYLLNPANSTVAGGEAITAIARELNGLHHSLTAATDVVKVLEQHDTHQVHYLYLVERLDLSKDIAAVAELQAAAQAATESTIAQYIFGAERLIAQIEAADGRPFQPPPAIVHTLHDPRRLFLFWAAYSLGMIRPQARIVDGQHREQFLWIDTQDGIQWPLTGLDTAVQLGQAIYPFVHHQAGQAPLSQAEIEQRIEAAFDAAARERVMHWTTEPLSLAANGSSLETSTLQNMRGQVQRMPPETRTEVETLIARCVLLNEWRPLIAAQLAQQGAADHQRIADYVLRQQIRRWMQTLNQMTVQFFGNSVPRRPKARF